MASVMLATYPDVFAGGAIIAGLPYGAAVNVQQAFASMAQSPPRSARAWGDLVRNASPHKGSWPRISVWHGSADATVAPSNARELLKQWADLHGISTEPSFTENVDQFPRQVWRGVEGDEVIESYTIPNMAHGTPLEVGEDCDQCGTAGAFLLDVGISSSYRIAKFWGIADHQIVTTQAEGHLVPISAELNVVGMEDSQRERVSAFESASAPEPYHFDISTVINGETLQHSNTRNLIFAIPALIEYLSSVFTLEPGDIVSTGTPAGVGFSRNPPRWLRPG